MSNKDTITSIMEVYKQSKECQIYCQWVLTAIAICLAINSPISKTNITGLLDFDILTGQVQTAGEINQLSAFYWSLFLSSCYGAGRKQFGKDYTDQRNLQSNANQVDYNSDSLCFSFGFTIPVYYFQVQGALGIGFSQLLEFISSGVINKLIQAKLNTYLLEVISNNPEAKDSLLTDLRQITQNLKYPEEFRGLVAGLIAFVLNQPNKMIELEETKI